MKIFIVLFLFVAIFASATEVEFIKFEIIGNISVTRLIVTSDNEFIVEIYRNDEFISEPFVEVNNSVFKVFTDAYKNGIFTIRLSNDEETIDITVFGTFSAEIIEL